MQLFVAWLLCGLTIIKADTNANYDYYTAGVIEYSPGLDNLRNTAPGRYVANNLQAYLNFIELAKKENVDILVFSEATLNYLSTREAMLEYAIALPDPADKIAPWEHDEYSEVLKEISKKCKDEKIYVLVNLIQKVPCGGSRGPCLHTRNDGHNLFNTNVVFDKQGKVISIYQKYNLFVEPLVEEAPTPQHSTFTTDFGVKFGHFICFDILFKEPAVMLIKKENITNILYPSKWYSENPFYTSTQTHQGWAYANNINLISAGANSPSEGSSGSGIYIGRKEIAKIIISPVFKSTLLTAKVPKDIQQYDGRLKSEKHNSFSPLQMQNLHISEYFASFDVTKIDIMDTTQTICASDNICCTFNIKIKKNPLPPGKIAYKYKLIANRTTRMFSTARRCGEFYCSIVACKSDDPSSCSRKFKDNRGLFNAVEFESIDITAKVKYESEDDIIVLPSTQDTSILPLQIQNYDFSLTRTFDEAGLHFKEYRIQSKQNLKDIFTFGIYGRDFALDESKTPTKSIK